MEIYNQVNRNTSIIQKLLRKVYPNKYNNKEAIIVIRHSIDVDNDDRPTNNQGIKYTLPNSQIITPYYENSLTHEGNCASENYAIILNKIVSDLGLSTINRVVIKDPEINEKSSNTFFTALPFINNNKIQDVRLRTNTIVDNKEVLELEDDDLITKKGSILVCWSQDTLWSEKNQDGDREDQPDNTSILGILNNTYNISCNIQGPPRKGVTIYIYLEDTVLHIYSMLTNPLRYEVGYKKNF